jgi:FKBP-type peptidyl-prolyl cis-trans isomerase SlyD
MERAIWIEYELKLSDGSLLESNTISFVPGKDQILPALEKRIRRLRPGESMRGVLNASEAFGDPALLPISEIARTEFPADAQLEVGRRFEAHTAGGDKVKFDVVEVKGKTVCVRILHPLADQDVSYRVRVIAIEGLPPPLPAAAIGIDSAAIQLVETAGEIN